MTESLSILAAMGLGALHAMEPGHGKSVLSAYIISIRAKALQAVLLGLISSAAHALSILVLASLAAWSVQSLAPDRLIQWLGGLSGLLIICIGISRIVRLSAPRIVTVRKWTGGDIQETAHRHRFHVHGDHPPATLKQFLTIGLTTGILPCPSAMTILLAAVGSHHFLAGIQLVFAFSIGGALTMALLGYVVSKMGAAFARTDSPGALRGTAYLSAVLIVVLGSFVFINAIRHL